MIKLVCDRCGENVLCDGTLTIRRANGNVVPERMPKDWLVVDADKQRDLCPACVEALKWFFIRKDHHGDSISCLVKGCEKPIPELAGLYCNFHDEEFPP